tara:strand:- start:143 stop:334 length:192 start_codon:yes stop_codon:yes gene_type:complete
MHIPYGGKKMANPRKRRLRKVAIIASRQPQQAAVVAPEVVEEEPKAAKPAPKAKAAKPKKESK